MIKYVIKRILLIIPTMLVVLFVIFNYVVNYGIRRHGNPVFEL